ncbi:MAG: SatD family protein [Arachnia sp.]
MGKVKLLSSCVALVGDVVDSRSQDRLRLHEAMTAAVTAVNDTVAALDPLRPTVGDEVQGVYAGLGEALAASYALRSGLLGHADVRFGLGGGEVSIVDAALGIQDGSAWWLARQALEWVEDLSRQPGHASARTAIRDQRPTSVAAADALARLVDAQLAGLRDGARRSLAGLLRGLDNHEVAAAEKISASANSQRIINNDLRPLADAIAALSQLP